MDTLDLLEKRIESLEAQILPKNTNFATGSVNQNITELLNQTHTMVSSALRCRESVTAIIRQMNIINEYLDPNNGELEVEAKRYYLLELYPELTNLIKLITIYDAHVDFTNSDSILKVTELSGKLESLAVFNLSIFGESQEVTRQTIETLQKYNDIIKSLKLLFAQMDKTASDVEAALVPKFKTEE